MLRSRSLAASSFIVDATLIEACASLESFKKKDASKDDEPPPDDPGNHTVTGKVRREVVKLLLADGKKVGAVTRNQANRDAAGWRRLGSR